MEGYIDIFYFLNFSLYELNTLESKKEYYDILKKIYFSTYSKLGEITRNLKCVEFFDDGNIEEDGIKNIYFKLVHSPTDDNTSVGSFSESLQIELKNIFQEDIFKLSCDKYIKFSHINIHFLKK